MRPSLRPAVRRPGLPVLAFALTLLAVPVDAQPAAWTSLGGPNVATFRTTAVADDGTLFGGTATDVYRYAAGRWTRVAEGVNGALYDIAAAPGGRVWAGTNGALRSLNGGLTWQWLPVHAAPHTGANPVVPHVAVGPEGTVYATSFRSADGGQTWAPMSVHARAVAFAGGAVYAGSFDGVYRSTDRGATWAPAGLAGSNVVHLAASGGQIVAATVVELYVSDDGASWTPTAALPGVRGLAVDGGGAVWAAGANGLYRSGDGTVWPSGPTAFAGRDVLDVAASGATVLALVEGHPYRSTDGGQTWHDVSDGLGMPSATSAVAGGGLLAVASLGAGVFSSSNGGTSWAPWNAGLPEPAVQQLAADPSTSVLVARSGQGLYVSSVAGTPWSPLPSLPGGETPAGVVAHSGQIFALATSGEGARVYRSLSGTSWELVVGVPDERGAGIAAAGGVIAAATGSWGGRTGVLVSTDGGATWAVRPHPAPGPSLSFGQVFVDEAGRVYVDGPDDLLRRSTDGGATWETLGAAGSGAVTSVVAGSAGPLCVGTRAGVWCSADGGATFTSASAGLPDGGSADVVALVRDGARYVALTADDGAFAAGATVAAEPDVDGAALELAVAPNPLGGHGAVALTLRTSRSVTVSVYDALGRRVATLHEGPLAAGTHALAIDAGALPPGVYVVRAASAGWRVAARVAVAR